MASYLPLAYTQALAVAGSEVFLLLPDLAQCQCPSLAATRANPAVWKRVLTSTKEGGRSKPKEDLYNRAELDVDRILGCVTTGCYARALIFCHHCIRLFVKLKQM